MKTFMLVFALVVTAAAGSYAADDRRIAPDNRTVYVQFQYKTSGGSWQTGTTSLRGSTSESMICNALASRYPDRRIRVLAVSDGKPVRYLVRYQISRDHKTWTSGSTVLQNALTQSMAANQISARNPGMYVRIVSMIRQ